MRRASQKTPKGSGGLRLRRNKTKVPAQAHSLTALTGGPADSKRDSRLCSCKDRARARFLTYFLLSTMFFKNGALSRLAYSVVNPTCVLRYFWRLQSKYSSRLTKRFAQNRNRNVLGLIRNPIPNKHYLAVHSITGLIIRTANRQKCELAQLSDEIGVS